MDQIGVDIAGRILESFHQGQRGDGGAVRRSHSVSTGLGRKSGGGESSGGVMIATPSPKASPKQTPEGEVTEQDKRKGREAKGPLFEIARF